MALATLCAASYALADTDNLEEVIVQVRPIESRLGRTDLVQVSKVVVDKVREGLRWVHA